jgi:hypothetical protein
MRGLEGDYRDWAQIVGWASGIAQAVRTGSGWRSALSPTGAS